MDARSLAVIALAWLACASQDRLAAFPTDPVVRFDHYAVEGRTLDEIRRDLVAKGPRDPLGRRRAASTDWSLAWRYACLPQPDQGAVAQIETSTAITITLPSLRGKVPPDVHAEWQTLRAALAAHEDGHRRITLACRDELAHRLAQLGPARDCAEVERTIAATGDAVNADCRARHAAFDRETEHGMKVGSRF